jgi:GTPase SAR1 family protein
MILDDLFHLIEKGCIMFPTIVMVFLMFVVVVVVSMVSEVSNYIVILVMDKIDDYRHTQFCNEQAEAHYAEQEKWLHEQAMIDDPYDVYDHAYLKMADEEENRLTREYNEYLTKLAIF